MERPYSPRPLLSNMALTTQPIKVGMLLISPLQPTSSTRTGDPFQRSKNLAKEKFAINILRSKPRSFSNTTKPTYIS